MFPQRIMRIGLICSQQHLRLLEHSTKRVSGNVGAVHREHFDAKGVAMKTSVMEVRDMLSELSVDEVERRIGEVPGVESVTVNYAAGNATVRYDETRLEIADIRSAVRQRGHESASPAATTAGDGHKGHTVPGAPATTLPKPPPAAPAPTSAAPGEVSEVWWQVRPVRCGLCDRRPPTRRRAPRTHARVGARPT